MFGSSLFADPGDWTHYGHTSSRISIAVDGPDTIDASTFEWLAWEDPSAPEYYLEFIGLSSPVVYAGKVYVYAKYYDENDMYTNNQIVCFDNETGQGLWYTPIDKRIEALGSFSSPCVDTKNNTVMIGSGYKVFAMDADTGDLLWSAQLHKTIVNASVCLALDIAPARAFITDYDGGGSQGRIYCINLDPNEPAANPYNPGDIIWSDVLGGTCGNSPAYQDGIVYVASITDPNHSWSSGNPNPTGTVSAYDATAEPNSIRVWRTTDSRFDGFWGGVCVTKEGFLYAANFDFSFEENNSALCKIDCSDGRVIWETQTEKTKSMPIVVGNMIYICGGLDGDYGSRPKLQAFRDFGDSVQLLWETPSTFPVGGWTHQPVYANDKLYIGKTGSGGYNFGPCTDLYILDTRLTPLDAGFVVDHYAGCGSSPAVTHNSLYTIGADGLHKFFQPFALSDVNRSGGVDSVDLQSFTRDWLLDGPVGAKRTDFNLDGNVDFSDYVFLAKEWLQ